MGRGFWFLALALVAMGCGGTHGGGGGGGGHGGSGGGENHTPYLDIIGDREVTVARSLVIVLSTSQGDPGEQLTFSADGSVGPGGNPFLAASPASFDAGSATFSWTPAETDLGDYNVRFRVVDDGEPPLSSTQTIAITVNPNRPPSLHLTDFGEPEEATIPATVGTPLTRESGVDGFVTWGTDPDGDALAVTVDATAGPYANPFLAASPLQWDPAAGLLTWDPAHYDDGCYSLTLTVTDDGSPALSDSAALTFVVEPNFAPYFVEPKLDLTVSGGKLLSVIYIARDNNAADMVSLSHGPTGLPGAANDPFITNGALSAFATFTAGIFTWTPGVGDLGTYTFWIAATDNTAWAARSDIVVTVEVVAAAGPELAPLPDRVVAVGSELRFTLSATHPDPEATVTLGSAGLVPADANSATAAFDPATGLFSWTPTQLGAGTYSVELSATDGLSPASATVQVGVVDGATDDGMVVVSEVSHQSPGAQAIELTNLDAHSVDLAGWELCGGESCFALPALVLPPGGLALVAWDHLDPGADASAVAAAMAADPCSVGRSVTLYGAAGQAGGAAAVRAFVQWQQTGEAGEEDALGADPPRWRPGGRVPVGEGSLCLAGTDPTRAESWVYDPTPTLGEANDGCL